MLCDKKRHNKEWTTEIISLELAWPTTGSEAVHLSCSTPPRLRHSFDKPVIAM